MNTAAARLAALETVVSRIAASRGERISTAPKLARQRSQRGEVAPILHDLGALERQAQGRGLSADMARAAIRMARGIAPEALLPATVERKDAAVLGAGCSSALPIAPSSTALAGALAGHSVSDRDLLLQRIDATLARAGGHV
jgi:hypothetical protein